MSIVLGPAVPEQFTEVLSFWRAATEVASSTDDVAGLTALRQHDPDALIVATDDGVIVGTVIAAWDGWRAAFYRLAVAPSHRRLGLGRALVEAGEAKVRTNGARRLSLYAVELHPGAMAFWDAAGYQRDWQDVRFVRNLAPPAPS